MTREIAITLLACATLSSCSKPTTAEAPVEDVPAPSGSTPTPATPKLATPVAAVATPPLKRLAPSGVFFLLQKKSVETADGITGYKPGTQALQQADGSFLIEGKKLQLRPDEITNDLDIAARAAGADAQRQAAIHQLAAAQAPVAPASASAASSASGSRNSSSDANRVAAQGAPPATSSAAPIGANNSLGATHTMTRDGWIWQKNEYGDWRRVKPLR